MKIINQTSDELVLKEGSGFNFVFSFGFMLLSIGLGYMMYHSGQPGNLFLVSLIPFTIGLLWFLFIPSVIVNFNKINGQIVYQKKRIIGTKILNYSIADILRIETRKNWSIVNEQITQQSGFSNSFSRKGLRLMTQSLLILKDGNELPLNTANGVMVVSSTIDSSNPVTENEANIAKKVAEFINVPFQEIQPPQISL